MNRFALLLALLACPLVCHAAPPAAAPATTKPAPPQIPEVLAPLKASIKPVQLQVGGPLGNLLHLHAAAPLSEEQWAAIEQLGVRGFYLSGSAFGDVGMPQLARLDPTALMFWGVPMTDAGAEHFATMKSLKVLTFVHAGDAITKQTAHVIENHPALEFLVPPGAWFNDPPTYERLVKSCTRLRAVAWGHIGSDAYCTMLEHHPALEDLWFWPDWNPPFITDAGVTSLTTLPKLKKLWLEYSRATYDGSLKRLKDVPGLETLTLTNMLISDDDLARLKADLPNVKIMFTPMKPEHRAAFERKEAMRDMSALLKDAGIQLQADPLDPLRTMLVLGSSTAAPTADVWAAIEPLRTKFAIRAFGLTGGVGTDATIGRLAAFDPTTLVLTNCPVTDAGLAHIAGMKSLRGLHLPGCGGITPAAAAVVSDHPAVSNLVLPPAWVNDPAAFKAMLTNPRLAAIVIAQRQATDAACALLAKHPGLEQLSFSPQGTAGLTNAGLASLATLPKLTKLSISSSRFSYDGGLEHLAKLPSLTSLTLSNVVVPQSDIDRLKAALPKTTQLTFRPMPPAAVADFEKLEAAAKQPAGTAGQPR